MTNKEIFALVSWPEVHTGKPFGPVPTFEKLMGIECETCGGSGMWGGSFPRCGVPTADGLVK